MKKGFTLIEVLVVILIVGVLAAVAVSYYQRAMLKSRFNSLMPVTKAIRNANEAYYLYRSHYSDTSRDLDVTLPEDENITVELSNDLNYAYTLSTHRKLDGKNNLIMYQQKSVNFPGETHCEAKADDTLAEWLCENALQGTLIEGDRAGSAEYKTYVLEGTGAGLFASAQDPDQDDPEGTLSLEAFLTSMWCDPNFSEMEGVSCSIDTANNTVNAQWCDPENPTDCEIREFSIGRDSQGHEGYFACTYYADDGETCWGELVVDRTFQTEYTTECWFEDDSGSCYFNTYNFDGYDYSDSKYIGCIADGEGNCTEYLRAGSEQDDHGEVLSQTWIDCQGYVGGPSLADNNCAEVITRYDRHPLEELYRGCSAINANGECEEYTYANASQHIVYEKYDNGYTKESMVARCQNGDTTGCSDWKVRHYYDGQDHCFTCSSWDIEQGGCTTSMVPASWDSCLDI